MLRRADCMLNQGHKGELSRILATSARADFLEALSNDPQACAWGRDARLG